MIYYDWFIKKVLLVLDLCKNYVTSIIKKVLLVLDLCKNYVTSITTN